MVLTFVFSVVAQLFVAGLIPAYMAEYETKGKDGFQADDVWQRFAGYFAGIAGYGILSSLIVIVGFLVLFFPGVYLSVPMAFVLYVLVIEDRKGKSLFKRSFGLVRNQWWKTFGIILLAYLILAIVAGLFSLPSVIVGAVEGFLVGSGQKESMEPNSLAIILTTIFSGLGQYLLYAGLYVVIAFQYYSLREQKDGDRLMEKVSAIKEDE
jgi:TRAP-type C4-dicarboxylate transport system permease large subunit